MIILLILTTSLIHFSLKGWENVLFELGSERVKGPVTPCRFTSQRIARRSRVPRQLSIHLCVRACACVRVCVFAHATYNSFLLFAMIGILTFHP